MVRFFFVPAIVLLLLLNIMPLAALDLDGLADRLDSSAMTSSPAAMSGLGGAASDFVSGTTKYWKDYASDWRTMIGKINDGRSQLSKYQDRWDRIQEKMRNGERLSMIDKILKKRVDAGREQIVGEVKTLAWKPVADGFNFWQGLPGIVKSVFSFF